MADTGSAPLLEVTTVPLEGEAAPATPRPVGVLAALLAAAITVVGLLAGHAYAIRLAGRYLSAVAAQRLPIKWESLTFQRAALANGHYLPIYGSSELYYSGAPFIATQLFASMPTGFDAFAVGRAGTADLFYLQTFAALGHDLHGKKLVLSDSPPWFFSRSGTDAGYYNGNFSPEIADMFVFDAPISLGVRELGAMRMLDYPKSLSGRPLLRLALEDLAGGSPRQLLSYAALVPVGRLEAWVKQLQDAYQTVQYIRQHPDLRPDGPPQPRLLDWSALVKAGTNVTRLDGISNPFGFPTSAYTQLLKRSSFRQALDLYCSGRTNRDGAVYGYPTTWEQNMRHSAEWLDLDLELRVLRELGAQPLIWTLPLPGAYDDETEISQPARQEYYAKYMRVSARAQVPVLDFQANDEDHTFLQDTGAHFTPRGWIFADRALDMFWHGSSAEDIRAGLASLNAESPPTGLPPAATSGYCG